MAVDMMLTADMQDINQWDVVTVGSGKTLEISTDTARTGTRSFKMFGSNSSSALNMSKNCSSRADYYFKVCFYAVSNNTNVGNYPVYINFREGSTIHVSIEICVYGGIKVYRNATYLGSASGVNIAANTWYCLEGYVKINDTTGEVTLKIDGTQVANLTSKDTKNGGAGNIDNLQIIASTYYTFFYFDDIVMRDDTWPGRGGIIVLGPTSDGSVDNWTASAGNQYECVDDNPPNDYTDYISTDVSTLNTVQLFGMSDLSGTFNSIPVVACVSKAKLDGAGSGNIRGIIKSSSSYGNGNSVGLNTSSKYVHACFTTNPNGGGAWNKAAVDALEAGVETI